MIENLFSYGTLQRPEVQQKLFGRMLKGNAEVLKGYRIQAIEVNDEKFLAAGEAKDQLTVIYTANENDHIDGFAFELTPDELNLADKYEPANYKRIEVECESGKMPGYI